MSLYSNPDTNEPAYLLPSTRTESNDTPPFDSSGEGPTRSEKCYAVRSSRNGELVPFGSYSYSTTALLFDRSSTIRFKQQRNNTELTISRRHPVHFLIGHKEVRSHVGRRAISAPSGKSFHTEAKEKRGEEFPTNHKLTGLIGVNLGPPSSS